MQPVNEQGFGREHKTYNGIKIPIFSFNGSKLPVNDQNQVCIKHSSHALNI